MPDERPSRPLADRILLWALRILPVLIFGYVFYLSWEHGDVVAMVLVGIAAIVTVLAAIRWQL